MELTAEEAEQAANLWDVIHVEVNYKPHLERHRNYDFLGFADLTLSVYAEDPDAPEEINIARRILSGFAQYVNDTKVKILKDQPYLETHKLPSATEGDENWYHTYAPGSKVFRSFLTTAVFSNEEVLEGLEKIKTMPKPAGAKSERAASAGKGDNPYR